MNSILDKQFRYTPSTSTSVAETWRKHGFNARTVAQQQADAMRASKEVDAAIARLRRGK